jgi:hypothetical protein
LHRLTALEVWGIYRTSGAQVRELLASPHLGNLRTLILAMDQESREGIDDGVLVEGLASPHRANLRYLGVNFNEVSLGPSERVIRGMIASPHLSRVRQLKLPNSRLSAELMAGLFQAMPRLQRLDLSFCAAPAAAWERLLDRARSGRLCWLGLYGATVADRERGHSLSRIPRYRHGFQEAGVRVDWSSRFIGPGSGGSWKGYSWAARRQQHLFAMNRFVRAGDYDGLEEAYREDCEKYAGEKVMETAAALPFESYETSLHAGMTWAVAEAVPRGARAIFLRARSDYRNWASEFHLDSHDPGDSTEPHTEFRPGEPLARFGGPAFPEAGDLFLMTSRSGPLDPDSLRHYLWARTVAALGRCVRQYRPAVPVFFSCVWAVFRLPEG